MKSANSTVPAYGNWPSVITAELIVNDNISLEEPRPGPGHGQLYYIERRPHEGGRNVIVRADADKTVDVLPAPYSARSRVHEYGGGSYCVTEDMLFFINDADQDIYFIQGDDVSRITATEDTRYADFCYDTRHHRLIAVCEKHENDQVTNSLVSISIKSGEISTLAEGNDFYASPQLDRLSQQLCWISWDFPNMPWDGNRLWLAAFDAKGDIADKKFVAGGQDISIFQPRWSPDNRLFYVSDETGWWHLYRYAGPESETAQQLTEGEKEFGLPQWVFAQSTYAFLDEQRVVCCYQADGTGHLALLTIAQKITLKQIDSSWSQFDALTATDGTICFIAASASSFPQLVTASIENMEKPSLHCNTIKHASRFTIDEHWYSKAQNVAFTNRHDQLVHALYYPPVNPEIQKTTTDAAPPLIVICHGGPTGQTSAALDPRKQFWTSRGFALLDVNYSGSTGYGRRYRRRLENRWGQLDVEDCCDAALFAVSQGLANEDQLIIRGSSAGGFTVLAALTFEDVFSAGASYYGISELCSLADDTHKFEARYLDRLIGPFPEDKKIYQQRSPINHTDRLNCPVIFFQGLEDRVVPKEQAETMFDALDKKGLPVAAQYFEGEQHGFRKAETIVQSLENELCFYRLIFDLTSGETDCFKGDIHIKNSSPEKRHSV